MCFCAFAFGVFNTDICTEKGGGQPPFSATINVTADDNNILVGEQSNLTVDWQTNRAVTMESWSVNGVVVQGPNETTSGTGRDFTVDSSFVFNGTAAGTFEVCYRIWHHQQQISDGRDARACVNIVVTEPPPPPTPVECTGKPATAIANDYLDDINYPKGNDGDPKHGSIISHVAEEMNNGTFGERCLSDGSPNPAYEAAVKAYIQGLIGGTTSYSWFW